MGAEPWLYLVPYRENIEAALRALQEEVFRAGRFRFSELKPKSIAEAVANAGGDTGSILDVQRVTQVPGFGCVSPLSQEALEALYGTDKPSRAQVMADRRFFEEIDRGHAVYIVLYANGSPSEILFAGYSFD